MNGMVINELKSLYFTDRAVGGAIYGSPIDGIERVTHCKLLGVIVQDTFSVDMHITYILSIFSQRIFLLKRLRDQGLRVSSQLCCFMHLRFFYAIKI